MSDEALTNPLTQQYLTFELAEEAYGVEILKVQEIRGWEPIREIPNTPPFIKGALNLRGAVVPIVDLRERFGMAALACTPTTVVIVLYINNQSTESTMGIIADAVSDVLDIPEKDIRAAPNLGSKIDTHYMRGMYVDGKRLVMLLNSDKLLDPEAFGAINDW